MKMTKLDLARDVLDQQVVDREGTKMGRVDGLVLELRADAPPRVTALEMGFVVLARRIHPRVETWLERLRRRFSVRKTARYRVPWAKVTDIHPYQIQIDVAALETPTFDWERWLRKHVIPRLPGSLKQ
jgi:sporulation protein YlmC with PRC-barrel domain